MLVPQQATTASIVTFDTGWQTLNHSNGTASYFFNQFAIKREDEPVILVIDMMFNASQHAANQYTCLLTQDGRNYYDNAFFTGYNQKEINVNNSTGTAYRQAATSTATVYPFSLYRIAEQNSYDFTFPNAERGSFIVMPANTGKPDSLLTFLINSTAPTGEYSAKAFGVKLSDAMEYYK